MKIEYLTNAGESLSKLGKTDSPPSREHSVARKKSELASRIEQVLHADCDETDAILQDEMESAIRGCQNTQWAEMMAHHDGGFTEEDVCAVVDQDDYSF